MYGIGVVNYIFPFWYYPGNIRDMHVLSSFFFLVLYAIFSLF
jgi:hypothetical protein